MQSSALLFDAIGAWVAFFFTLMVFSALAGDNPLARLAQHILVGAALGYAAVLAARHVLLPRLFDPLARGEAGVMDGWLPLGMAAVLIIAGVDRIVFRTAKRNAPPGWRRLLHGAGRLVTALLLGIGLGAGIMGALQGTLIPQYLRAAQIGFVPSAPGYLPLVGLLTLVLTTATLLHLYLDPARHLDRQPGYARGLMAGWLWLGQRALWLAAGLIFARLAASRLSLLIARITFLTDMIHDTAFWTWLQSL
jgi:hypothetical protein